jgi:ribonuclease J
MLQLEPGNCGVGLLPTDFHHEGGEILGKKGQKIRFIPLGGMGEIGKNMLVLETAEDILVIDAGLEFPDDDLLGVDLVIPNTTYLKENLDKVRGIFVTHGHEDHIGGLPYILREVPVPVYGTRLSLGLLKNKLDEFGLTPDLHEVAPGQTVAIGSLKVQAIRVNHSVPDSVAVAVHTPIGVIMYTGDFKFDQTPVDGKVTDFHTLAEYGSRGILALISDSTNAMRPGVTPSESLVGRTFDSLFARLDGRIIVATFASNIHRVQQVLNTAQKYHRKVAIVGRSMINNVQIATDQGYIQYPKDLIIEPNEVDKYPDNRVVVVSTGSQGEPLSGLTRMASQSHPTIKIRTGDTVVMSSTPIPGNEKLVARVMDNLARAGAEIIYQGIENVHVSGHAAQDELKMMMNLVRPKFVIPFHGEYRHRTTLRSLAIQVGVPEENIFIMENGDVLELSANAGALTEKVTAGSVFVDGLGIGDVGHVVLRDRQQMAQDGVLIVVVTINKQNMSIIAGPDVITRGFVYVRESEQLLNDSAAQVTQALNNCLRNGSAEWSELKDAVRNSLSNYLYEKTKRRPMILPIIMEI